MPGRLATTRSKRGSQNLTQSNGRRRGLPASDDESDNNQMDVDDDENSDDDDDGQDADLRNGNGDTQRKAAALVRLALFTEYRRVPLKREDITKKVMGKHTRDFNQVFSLAQQKLRKTFGMELVELKHKGALANEDSTRGQSTAEKDAENGGRKKTAPQRSNAYILRSTLPMEVIELASQSERAIKEAEDAEWGAEARGENGIAPITHGSLISWNTADQLEGIGILNVILGLILVGGRVLSTVDLMNHLKRLNIPQFSEHSVQLNYSTIVTPTLSTPKFLESLIKGGWIERHVLGGAKTKKGAPGAKRTLPTGEDAVNGNERYEWRWGPRAHSEIGEKESAQWIANFMVTSQMTGELTEQQQKAAGEKVKKVYAGIEKVAGGGLRDVM
ncbi:MAGE-domain-containing protein [Flagelloscypha sp. PMI_526]|nr:MAGE-domain-containing protein [Flagelloscypha sp. PMI_526]